MPVADAVFLSLGSNLGDRHAALRGAEDALRGHGFETCRRSTLYETEPVGGPPQGPYLNRVLEGSTALSPAGLLRACLDVEHAAGRVRAERNGPRTLDVDILLYGEDVVRERGLVIPHARLHERRFVLVPLSELVPGLRHPVLGRTMADLLADCADDSAVRPMPG